MKVDMWFPTPIASHTIDNSISTNIKDAVLEWNTTSDKNNYLDYYYGENLTTSYHKYHDIIGLLNLRNLKEEILKIGIEFSKGYGMDLISNKIKLDSWINFFEPGNSEVEHNHFGNYLSGVYYVDAVENSGNYEFYDPAKQRVLWSTVSLKSPISNFINMKSHVYSPHTGMMIMFPSYLDHSVLRNRSASTRISIAFNINII